jgi:hypothetical protein
MAFDVKPLRRVSIMCRIRLLRSILISNVNFRVVALFRTESIVFRCALFYVGRFLSLLRGSSFTSMHHLDSYMATVHLRMVEAPYLTISEDFTKFNYRSFTLDLAKMRNGIQVAIEECRTSISNLAPGMEMNLNLPPELNDDFRDRRWGTNRWLDEDGFVEKNSVLKWHLRQRTGMVSRNVGGKLDINKSFALDWLSRASEIPKMLMNLIHVTGGQPCRGTELSDVRIRHMTREAGIRKDFGRTFILSNYNKTSSVFDKDVFTARMLPKAVAHLLDLYLFYIRPLETVIASRHLNEAAATNFHFYLFTAMGKKIENTNFSEFFRTFVIEKFDFHGGGVRAIRQLLILMAKEYLAPEFRKYVGDEQIGDMQAGHSTQTAHRVYGRSTEQGHVSSDQIHLFGLYSGAWHVFLGLVEGKPLPLPLRKLSKQFDVLYPPEARIEGRNPYEVGDDSLESSRLMDGRCCCKGASGSEMQQRVNMEASIDQKFVALEGRLISAMRVTMAEVIVESGVLKSLGCAPDGQLSGNARVPLRVTSPGQVDGPDMHAAELRNVHSGSTSGKRSPNGSRYTTTLRPQRLHSSLASSITQIRSMSTSHAPSISHSERISLAVPHRQPSSATPYVLPGGDTPPQLPESVRNTRGALSAALGSPVLPLASSGCGIENLGGGRGDIAKKVSSVTFDDVEIECFGKDSEGKDGVLPTRSSQNSNAPSSRYDGDEIWDTFDGSGLTPSPVECACDANKTGLASASILDPLSTSKRRYQGDSAVEYGGKRLKLQDSREFFFLRNTYSHDRDTDFKCSEIFLYRKC